MWVMCLKKKHLLAACALVAAAGIGLGVGTVSLLSARAANARRPIYSVDTTEKKVALTFDAAWGNSDTDKLIDILKKHNAKATFYTTGEWVDNYPADVKKLYAAGHDIQNHSNHHPHVKNIEPAKLIEDTKACDDKIEKLIGKRPTQYRAPYGEFSDSMLETFEKSLGHKVIQWDVDSIDWKRKSVDEMASKVPAKVREGSILLFHNDLPNTPPALDKILTTLEQKGYSFVLVEDLIYQDNYRLDATGRQIRTDSTAMSGAANSTVSAGDKAKQQKPAANNSNADFVKRPVGGNVNS